MTCLTWSKYIYFKKLVRITFCGQLVISITNWSVGILFNYYKNNYYLEGEKDKHSADKSTDL